MPISEISIKEIYPFYVGELVVYYLNNEKEIPFIPVDGDVVVGRVLGYKKIKEKDNLIVRACTRVSDDEVDYRFLAFPPEYWKFIKEFDDEFNRDIDDGIIFGDNYKEDDDE